MKVKTNTLIGAALDWAVAKCTDQPLEYGLTDDERYSTNWAQGGPIIDRLSAYGRFLLAASPEACQATFIQGASIWTAYGPTPLIAAMRVFVASRLGDEIDVPEELL